MPETYITEYNSTWPAHFQQIHAHLHPHLPPTLHLEHIGSTAIPGMPAKPIIDIDIVVPNGEMPAAIAAIARAGYTHQGDLGLPGREVFKPATPTIDALPPHHLYACEAESHELRKHLSFRDYLRAHPHEAERLAALKRHLTFDRQLTRSEYIDAKSDLVTELSQTALAWYNNQSQ